MKLGVVALVLRCEPTAGTKRMSCESTAAVEWLTSGEVRERMSEVFAGRVLDALEGNGLHVRSHDGKRLICIEPV
nr:hypothetical protein HEP84_17990 [Streptomyces sp. RLB1-33]